MLVWAATALLPSISKANEIYLEQVGNDATVTIIQEGEDNYIGPIDDYSTFEGDGNTVIAKQWGDDHSAKANIDGDRNYLKALQGNGSTTNNVCIGDITGNDNRAVCTQDRTDAGNADTTAYGNHTSSITLLGDDNIINTIQRNNGTNATDGHSVTVDISGNDADIDVKQVADFGKTANLDIDADNVTVDIFQTGHGDHNVDLTVSNNNSTFDIDQGYNPGTTGHDIDITTSGSYASDVTVSQQSNTPKSYSLTQICTNPAGCTVSILQQ